MESTKEIRDAHQKFERHIAGNLIGQTGPCDPYIYAFVNAAATGEPLAPNRLCTQGLERYHTLARAVKNYQTNGA